MALDLFPFWCFFLPAALTKGAHDLALPISKTEYCEKRFSAPRNSAAAVARGTKRCGVRGRCVRAGRRLMRRELSGGRQRRGQRGPGRLRAAQSRATGHSAAPPEPLPYRGLPAPPCRVTAGGGRCCLGEPCRGGRSHVFLSPPVTQ